MYTGNACQIWDPKNLVDIIQDHTGTAHIVYGRAISNFASLAYFVISSTKIYYRSKKLMIAKQSSITISHVVSCLENYREYPAKKMSSM